MLIEKIPEKCYNIGMTTNPLRSNGARQILGAAAGMLIATVLYVVMNDLPSHLRQGYGGQAMQVSKALLVEGNPTISTSAGTVSVNDKKTDSAVLKRIAARAQQVAAQIDPKNVVSSAASASSDVASSVTSGAVPVAVQDHADRTAWLAMREAQRHQNAALDVSAHRAASAPVAMIAAASVVIPRESSAAYPEVTYEPQVQPTTKTPLPNSGMGLNVIFLIAFILTLRVIPVDCRRALIAATDRAY